MIEILIILFLFTFLNFDKNFKQLIFQNIIILGFINFIYSHSFINKFIWRGIYYIIGIDIYSYGLILLRGWILLLILILSLNFFINNNGNLYIILMNRLILILILCFIRINLIIFYIYFEIRLIPIFLLIIGWGYQIDRIQAGIYIILYTLFGSMPLFIIIIYIYIINYSLIINVLLINQFNYFIYLSIIFAFLIKLPIYFVHLWLPKAHVEAPVIGSIILAGIILKLGRYGLLRSIILMIEIRIKFNKFIIIIRLIGGLYSRLICLCQVDIKILVAYSSVVHIRVILSGLITLFNWGILGGYLIILAHGLCSSGIFCLVNINYERFLSRRLFINKGLINYYPSLRLMWFLLCSSNLSFPPSLNLWREILLLNSLLLWSKSLIYLLILILFFRASYTLYLYSYSQHGKINLIRYSIKRVKIIDYLVLLLHWIPLNYLFIFIYIYI